jgi:hypothetical protein
VIRTRLFLGLTAAATVAAVLGAQGAYAATTLPDATVLTSSANSTSYQFNTISDYWSVVAVDTSADYDISLYDTGGGLLGSSILGTGKIDFIAINSNLRPLGTYVATVTHYAGSAPYYVEQRQGHTTTTLPTPTNNGVTGAGDPQLAFASVQSQDVISVSDIYLTAGRQFWVNVPDTAEGFYFLESNPADPSTFIRSRTQATQIAGTREAQGCTLYTGWHGLVEINTDAPPPHTTNPVSGLANALVGYDPSRPNTCPERNFPGPTPPGP